mgnify:CR=1 FL=1
MISDKKQENETLKKQLAGFREIHQVLSEIIAEVSQDQKEALICRHFKEISGADEISLFLFNPKTERFHFRTATGESARNYAGGFLIPGEGEFSSLPEPDLRPTYSHRIRIETENDTYTYDDKFIMVIPVTAFSTVYGILISEYDDPCTTIDNDKEELIRVFLTPLSSLFECYAERQRQEGKAKSLELLYEIGSKLSSLRDEEQILENIMFLIEKHLQVDRCSLMIIDEDRKYLRIKKAFGIDDLDINKSKVPLGVGIAGHVAMGTRPLLIKDIASEKNLVSLVQQKANFRTNSLLSVPLVSQGEVIGVINVNNRKDGLPFSVEDMELLSKIGSEIAAVLHRSYLTLQLKKARELDREIRRSMV